MILRQLKLGYLPTKIIIDEWFQIFLLPKPNYLLVLHATKRLQILWLHGISLTPSRYRCSPAPLSAFFIFFIQQKQRSLRLSCSLWSIDKWSGVMTLISDLVRPQLCMMLGRSALLVVGGGHTTVRYSPFSQMDASHCSPAAVLECVSHQQNIHWCPHTWSIAVIVIMTVCRAELGWAGNMTPWHGYDKSMTRVWWHIVSWSPALATLLVLGSSGWGNVDH